MYWFIFKTLLKLYMFDSVLDKTINLAFGGRQQAIYWLDEQMKELNKIYHQKLISQ